MKIENDCGNWLTSGLLGKMAVKTVHESLLSFMCHFAVFQRHSLIVRLTKLVVTVCTELIFWLSTKCCYACVQCFIKFLWRLTANWYIFEMADDLRGLLFVIK